MSLQPIQVFRKNHNTNTSTPVNLRSNPNPSSQPLESLKVSRPVRWQAYVRNEDSHVISLSPMTADRYLNQFVGSAWGGRYDTLATENYHKTSQSALKEIQSKAASRNPMDHEEQARTNWKAHTENIPKLSKYKA